jgi:hypothetical protein
MDMGCTDRGALAGVDEIRLMVQHQMVKGVGARELGIHATQTS